MKIVVLGGGGRVGRRIAEMLVARSLGEVTIADATPGDAVEGTERVVVDIREESQLASLLEAHDLVVNTLGPFDRWGGLVLDAAIAAGTDYLDICDDPLPTLDLLGRDAAAKAKGIRAIIGLGASPGLSNLLGVIAARQLDETVTLTNYWGDPHEELPAAAAASEAERLAAAFRGGRAALTHLIAQASGTVPIWKDGARADVRPWTETYEVRLSSGESGTYRLIGHPEPVTLPGHVAVSTSFCIGTMGKSVDRVVLSVLAEVEAGRLTPSEATLEVANRIEADPSQLVSEASGPPLPALIGTVACGYRGGEEWSVTAMPGGPTDGSMSTETARPAVLGIELLEGVAPGVHPPEGAFEPEEFLRAFSDREWAGAPPYRLDEQRGTMLELHRADA